MSFIRGNLLTVKIVKYLYHFCSVYNAINGCYYSFYEMKDDILNCCVNYLVSCDVTDDSCSGVSAPDSR